MRPDGKQARHADSAGVRPGRRQSAHLDRLGIGALLERLRRGDRDARRGHVLRCAAWRQGPIPGRRRRAARAIPAARRTTITPSWRRCTSTSCRSLPRSRRAGIVRRARRSNAARRCSRARPGARRCHVPPLYTEPGNNCTPRARSASTLSRPTARRPTCTAPRRWRACGRTRRAASITTAASPR